jgi:hypothetical protein
MGGGEFLLAGTGRGGLTVPHVGVSRGFRFLLRPAPASGGVFDGTRFWR